MTPMRAPIYQVDAFTSDPFRGNPAAVVPLEGWLPDHTLQAIARENNLSETAFFIPSGSRDAEFELRWFTPTLEVALCGHATLASGHVLMRNLGFRGERVRFQTRHAGIVGVEREGERLVLDFPVVPPVAAEPSHELADILGAAPRALITTDPGSGTPSYMAAVFEREAEIRAIEPDFRRMGRLKGPSRGNVIVTAPGSGEIDFVSRFFAPGSGIDEDPVTGSVHCLLTPYWAHRLGKTELRARQVSARGGELWCALAGDRVRIGGHAVTYMQGTIEIPG